jgi:hypothetical protein
MQNIPTNLHLISSLPPVGIPVLVLHNEQLKLVVREHFIHKPASTVEFLVLNGKELTGEAFTLPRHGIRWSYP